MYRRHTKGVVQIFSNIEDGAFFANSSRLLATYYFHKKFYQMFDTFQHIFTKSSIRCLTHSNILFSKEVPSDVWHIPTYYFHKKFHQMFDTFQHVISTKSSIRCSTNSNILFSQEVPSDVWHIPTYYFHKKFHQMFDTFQHIIFTRSSVRCLTHSKMPLCCAGLFWLGFRSCNNLGQNICRLFHFLAQFFFTTSETELDYHHHKVSTRVPERLKM